MAERVEVNRGPRLPDDFGDGWLSGPAGDLLRLAITIAGFPRDETIRRLLATADPARVTNIATVERILGEIEDADRRENR